MTLTLVTGGAGYIGAHVVERLLQEGHNVRVLDNLSTGDVERLKGFSIEFFKGDIQDVKVVKECLEGVENVVHLAASKSVEESVLNPRKYYLNNYMGTMKFLSVMSESNVKKVIFSSSAAVYEPIKNGLLDENSPTVPPSPYGKSKLMSERLLESMTCIEAVSFTCLRFFNVIGASNPNLGDFSDFNLIPKSLRRIQNGMSPVINGSSFNTVDGTCVRDYVDVRDVADAHVMALSAPQLAWDFEIFNLGSGHGYTVLEIISKLEEIMGSNLKPIFEDARAGDPPFLVAECSKIRRVLGWKPRYNLDSMIESSVNSWLSFERTQL